jgi:tetratricopeptide (TPR) repeat protein
VLFALKCARYWTEGLSRLETISNPFERGELILGLWRTFAVFQSRLQGDFERCRYAFKQCCFSLALAEYRELPTEEKDNHEGELALRIGRCLKGAGNYDEAIRELSLAAKERRDDAESLAELADAHALVNEMRESKALFREAFYLAPQKVALDFLECEMIARLIDRVREIGRQGAELAEWIPVYANLLGVFTVKRELKAVEAGKLRQSIYQLENELRESAGERSILVPRLINRYFWLIDHCIAAREDRSRVDEILLKLRLLEPQIHKQYTA